MDERVMQAASRYIRENRLADTGPVLLVRDLYDGAEALATQVRELEEAVAARDGVLRMAVARLGGEVDGHPTHRINFLQRIDALRAIEDRAAMEADESQEIIEEMSAALAVACEENLVPCVDPCPGHMGPKAKAVFKEALEKWREVEEDARSWRAYKASVLEVPAINPQQIMMEIEELELLRAVESHIIRLNEPVGNKGTSYAEAWNRLCAFRERQKTKTKEEKR